MCSSDLLTLSIHPDEIPDELVRDFVGARYACALVRIQDNEEPTPYVNRVSRAGMLCRTPDFHEYLLTQGLVMDLGEVQAADAVCDFCNIQSRSELNGNETAKDLFDQLTHGYELWLNKKKDPYDPF